MDALRTYKNQHTTEIHLTVINNMNVNVSEELTCQSNLVYVMGNLHLLSHYYNHQETYP